jgi:hypothetical protein
MKRILMVFGVFAALAVGGILTSTAQAHGPRRYIGCYPPPHCYGGGYGGYQSSFYGGYGGGYGCSPYGSIYQGGYSPYVQSSFYYQRPNFGIYLGY